MRAFLHRLTAMLLVCAFVLSGLAGAALASEEPEETAASWREEYEALNGETDEDGRPWPTVIIPEDLPVLFPTEEEALGLFRDGTGILYFGFPSCPWCRTLLPVLSEVLTEHPEITLFCRDLREDRDEYRLDAGGSPRLVRKGTAFYGELLSLLGEWLGPYQGLNDESLRRVYMPTLVFLRDGEIQSVHIGTVDGQESGFDPLTDEQRAELRSVLEEAICQIGPETE